MGGKTVQSIIFQPDNGSQIILNSETDKYDIETISTLFCDSPRCASRHDGVTTTLTWVEEKAKADPTSLPDSFAGLITIQPDPFNMDYRIIVCGPSCAKDFFTYAYQPPKTPRQRLAEQKASLKVNLEAQAAIDAQNPQIPLPFPEEAAQSIEQNAELLQMLADSDATGVK